MRSNEVNALCARASEFSLRNPHVTARVNQRTEASAATEIDLVMTPTTELDMSITEFAQREIHTANMDTSVNE